jgi:hypothetical protein
MNKGKSNQAVSVSHRVESVVKAEPLSELEQIISRFESQNNELDNILSNISSTVYRLHDPCELSDSTEKGEAKEPSRTAVDRLNGLLNWQRSLISRTREINNHLLSVI